MFIKVTHTEGKSQELIAINVDKIESLFPSSSVAGFGHCLIHCDNNSYQVIETIEEVLSQIG